MAARFRAVILIVALILSRHQTVPRVVVIIVPLRSVFSLRRIGKRIEQARTVVVVLQDQVNQSSSFRSEVSHGLAEVLQDRWLPRFQQRMNRVEAKAVEAVALEPVERVADGESANLWDAISDGVSPGRMSAGDEWRRVPVQVVTFRAEMFVDHVEKDHEPAGMRLVDQHP